MHGAVVDVLPGLKYPGWDPKEVNALINCSVANVSAARGLTLGPSIEAAAEVARGVQAGCHEMTNVWLGSLSFDTWRVVCRLGVTR